MARRTTRNSRPTRVRGTGFVFEFARHLKLGEVIENRGGIAVGGERLPRVRVGVPTTDAIVEFEIRAADVKSAA
jgi:hypothetical protein